MTYVRPNEVTSPKEHLKLIEVLYDGGPDSFAIAEVTWDQKPRIAARWNGNDVEASQRLGNPQSSGHATWFVLPSEWDSLVQVILRLSKLN